MTKKFVREHKIFVFREKMGIGRDIKPLKMKGWKVVREATVVSDGPEGTRTVTLTLRRIRRAKVKK